VSQLLQEMRREANTLLNACRQVPSANSVMPATGESRNSGDSFTFAINPVLPDDATESFTLQASYSSEDSEIIVESNAVAVNTIKPQSVNGWNGSG
jgi:hypothetical protein